MEKQGRGKAMGEEGGVKMSWDEMFHLTENYDPRQVIGRYYVSTWDWEEHIRSFGFRVYARYMRPIREEDFGWNTLLNKWELDQSYRPFRGVLRDLWELPENEPITSSPLSAGQLLWFLHCFELTHPSLFAYPRAYDWPQLASPSLHKLA